jgi:hypothetical protein
MVLYVFNKRCPVSPAPLISSLGGGNVDVEVLGLMKEMLGARKGEGRWRAVCARLKHLLRGNTYASHIPAVSDVVGECRGLGAALMVREEGGMRAAACNTLGILSILEKSRIALPAAVPGLWGLLVDLLGKDSSVEERVAAARTQRNLTYDPANQVALPGAVPGVWRVLTWMLGEVRVAAAEALRNLNLDKTQLTRPIAASLKASKS